MVEFCKFVSNECMMNILTVLLGSKARVRLLRFFLLNTDMELSAPEIAKRLMVTPKALRKELTVLTRIEFLLTKKTKGVKLFRANTDFVFRRELITLLERATIAPECKGLTKLQKMGDVRVILISGVFINFTKARVDLFIVANDISRVRLAKIIHELEAEIGREIQYMLLSADELKYRLNMTDRFLQDFLSDPHETVVNTVAPLKRFAASLRKSK